MSCLLLSHPCTFLFFIPLRSKVYTAVFFASPGIGGGRGGGGEASGRGGGGGEARGEWVGACTGCLEHSSPTGTLQSAKGKKRVKCWSPATTPWPSLPI